MLRIAIALVLAASMIIGASVTQGAGIPGAAGGVEFWRPLNGTPRRGVLFIVTHDSFGAFGSGRNTARNQSGGGIGAEWWVLADGTIIHSDSERVTGHCGSNPARGVGGNCNRLSVGIEFEGFLAKTEAQVRSGLALIRFLQERYCIQSVDVRAHGKDNGREGVAMERAAHALGYKPDCTGAVRDEAIPDNIVTAGTQAPAYTGPYTQGGPLGGDERRPTGSLLGQPAPFGQPSPLGQPAPAPQPAPIHNPTQAGGSSYLLGQSPYANPGSPTSYLPENGYTPATTSPNAATLLQQIAYPDAHGDESDDSSVESAKSAKKLTAGDTIVVIPLGTTTPILVPIGRTPTTTDAAYIAPTLQGGSTFSDAATFTGGQAFTSNESVRSQLTRIIDGVRAVVTGFLRLLNAEAR